MRRTVTCATWTAMLVLAGLALVAASAQSGSSHGLPAGFKDSPLLPGGTRENRQAAVRLVSPVEVTVPSRRSAQIDLHFQVAPGLHINSHAPREKTLIPTRLAVAEKGELEVTAVDFPPGVAYALAFSPKEKLSVYTGDFVLHVHLTVQPGRHLLEGALRYQACDMTSCLPPRSLPFTVGVVGK